MTVTMLNSGMYDVSEAALLLGRSTDELIRWASSGPDGGPAMVPATFQRAFSFADLVSLRVIVSLREAGIQEKDLRRGIAELRDYFVTDRPLARADILSRLATSGDSFLAELDGELIDIGRRRQGVFQDIVRVYVRRIQFGASGDPEVWRPADRVVLDPRIQAGAPCLAGTRIPTAAIAELAESETESDLALDFDVPVEDIQAALAFQRAVESGRGLAA